MLQVRFLSGRPERRKEMSKEITVTEKILNSLNNSSALESSQIAANINCDKNTVCALLYLLYKKNKVEREISYYNGPKPVYKYFKKAGEKPIQKIVKDTSIEKSINTSSIEKLVVREVTKAFDISKFEDLTNSIADSLVDVIMNKITERISSRIQDIIPTIKGKEYVIESIKRKEKQKSILIIGLLPQQCGIIQSQFGEDFDIRFWKEEGTKKLKDLCKGSDHILTFTSKISHQVENTVISEGRMPTRIRGGLTSLKQALQNLKEVSLES
jgi:predicted transcriptional regulator